MPYCSSGTGGVKAAMTEASPINTVPEPPMITLPCAPTPPSVAAGKAIDEYSGGYCRSDWAPAGGDIALPGCRQTIEQDVGRAGNDGVGAMAWQWAGRWVSNASCWFSTHFADPCMSVGLGYGEL